MNRTAALRLFIVALAVALLPAAAAHAWSIKEHIALTRLAAELMINDPSTPPAMKDWLIKANRQNLTMEEEKEWFLHQRVGMFPRNCDGLGFWGCMPDLAKGTGPRADDIEPFGLPESKLHFTDMEMFNPDPAKRTFKDDLSHKPKVSDFPRDMSDPRWKQAGMLPFRIQDVYAKMVKDFREKKLYDAPGQYPRDEHAAHWAGYLAHYLEDNCQPQHATVDFMARSYFGKQNTRAPNVHFLVEGTIDDDDMDDYTPFREEFIELFTAAIQTVQDPADTDDLFTATIEVALKSYDCLPLIGHAAMAGFHMGGTPEAPTGHPIDKVDAEKFYHFKGTVDGVEMTVLEMKAQQMALGVKRVQRVWRMAWDEAQKPEPAAAGK